jgi:hypothetical protein
MNIFIIDREEGESGGKGHTFNGSTKITNKSGTWGTTGVQQTVTTRAFRHFPTG